MANQVSEHHLYTIASDVPMPPTASAANSRPNTPSSPTSAQLNRTRARTNTASSVASATGSMLRRASLTLMNADPPPGMWAATGSTIASAPSLAEIRRGSFGQAVGNHEKQIEHDRGRRSSASSTRKLDINSSTFSASNIGRGKRADTEMPEDAIPEAQLSDQSPGIFSSPPSARNMDGAVREEKLSTEEPPFKPATPPCTDGYEEAPKLPWTTTWAIGLRAFWKWFLTPLGFLITVYGLNVVAWGGMLFLLLCNAAPAMCKPSCNDINSPRRIWIEIDSQILNSLFCVTGFGLVPWRFRDLYWLMVYRIGIRGRSQEQRMVGLRRLAGIHRGWFRLPGSDVEHPEFHYDDPNNPYVPIPAEKRPDLPLTGIRAPPTALWRMDYVIWMNCWNTFLQCVLCGFMWHYNRYKRPSWSTGLFVALACIVAGLAGIMMWMEGKKVKMVEGVPPKVLQRVEDAEKAVTGHNGHTHSDKFREVDPIKTEYHHHHHSKEDKSEPHADVVTKKVSKEVV